MATTKTGRLTTSDKAQKKSQAKQLYIQEFNLTSISEIIKVGIKTLTNWRDSDNWDKESELTKIRPSEIKQMILEYIQDLKEGKTPKYKADDLSKIAAAFDRLEDNRKKAVYTMESFDGFCNFLLNKAAKLSTKSRTSLLKQLQDIRPLLDSYVNQLLSHE